MIGFSISIHRINPSTAGQPLAQVTAQLEEAGLATRASLLSGMRVRLAGELVASCRGGSVSWARSLDEQGRGSGIGTGGYPDRYWMRVADALPHIPPSKGGIFDGVHRAEDLIAELVAREEWVILEAWDQS